MKPFEHLDEAQRRALLDKARTRRYERDEFILREGGPHGGIFIVRRGTVRVEKEHLGQSVPVNELGPGDVFGEMSFLEESVASASIVADETVDVAIIARSDVQELLESDPIFAAALYRSLAIELSRRLRHSTDQVASIPYSGG